MASETLSSVPMAQADAVLERRPRLLIDLRSPREFAEDHLPGAVNVPLFDDLERALIGTLYARSSPAAAFEAARARTLERIGGFTREIAVRAGWRLPDVDLARRVLELTDSGMERLERELEPAPAAL